MKPLVLLTLLFYLFSQHIVAQNYRPGNRTLLASGLPLIEIETEGGVEPTCEAIQPPEGCMGVGITNKTKVPSRMTITQGEDLLYDSGEYEKDSCGLILSIRGNTSAALSDKKPYKIKLQKKADLLFRGDSLYRDKEWGLLKCENGKFMNSLVGFKVNELAGLQWTPHFMYVNVIINNDYKGVYMLMETVKNSKARLSIDKKSGYIIEYDAYWWNENLCLPEGKFFKWTSMRYTFKYPDPDDITQEQIDYILGRVEEMENSVIAGNYEQHIDVPSFAAWLIAHDILGNADVCGSNIFLTLHDGDLGTKFQMGNIWDMDAIELSGDNWAGIHILYGFFFKWLFESKNQVFLETYKNRWDELSPTLVDEMKRFLDDFVASKEGIGLNTCMKYDARRWGYTRNTLSEEKEKHQQWFTNRKEWLDEHVAEIRSPWKIYAATFDNTGAWEKVYAYTWNGDGNSAQEPLGEWPGTELIKNEETGFYDVTIKATETPENIIFNDGSIKDNTVAGVNKTGTYKFINDSAYKLTAVIKKVMLKGATEWDDDNNWTAGKEYDIELVLTDENTYTGLLTINDDETDYQFKLMINNGLNDIGLGNSELTWEERPVWISNSSRTRGSNFELRNSESGYHTYMVTATWTPNLDAHEKWSLKIEGKEAYPLKDFTVSLSTDIPPNKWKHIYVYIWRGDESNKIEFTGAWPGTEMMDLDTNDNLVFSFKNFRTPEKVVFNDGTSYNSVVGKNQSKEFIFENDELYVWNEYIVRFTTNRSWDSVYAYTWAGEDSVNVFSGLWPGTLLEQTDGIYEYRFQAEKEPQWIVFNDGTIEDCIVDVNKTKTYQYLNDYDYIDEIETAIHNVQQKDKRAPMIYNMNGQRVKKPGRGLYIINGKVVSVK